MYEPEIHINEDLMESLTLEEEKEWVESSPTHLPIDIVTQQVSLVASQISISYVLCIHHTLLYLHHKFYFIICVHRPC
ncbi:hypothetical protein Lalb_Chr16g0386241 [Lupinus albus]|uniref:Uncharacterized protein n=1 Tax=Lupinus albus TaxID=3870 RepID=A0A6A4P6M7_LUPAL|nr:hypothetical protein Lalb_Chr16g0386241 [Lupinus albus]